MPMMISLKRASEITGLSYNFLRKLCLAGDIVHIRAGNKYLINYERLAQYLNEAGVKK